MKINTSSNMSVATLERLGFALIKSDISVAEHKLFLSKNKGVRVETYQHNQTETKKQYGGYCQVDLYVFIGQTSSSK
jgi:hypothetical protein